MRNAIGFQLGEIEHANDTFQRLAWGKAESQSASKRLLCAPASSVESVYVCVLYESPAYNIVPKSDAANTRPGLYRSSEQGDYRRVWFSYGDVIEGQIPELRSGSQGLLYFLVYFAWPDLPHFQFSEDELPCLYIREIEPKGPIWRETALV
jgi:hypothetical protein